MMALQSSESAAMKSMGDLVGGSFGRLVLETRADQCAQHGDYINRHMRAMQERPSFWTGCPQCAEEVGRQKLLEQHARDVAEAAQARAKATAERFATSGVPKRFLVATWDNYRTTDTAPSGIGTQAYALARCRAYADNFATHLESGRALFMLGNSGTGKNHLATCIARQVADAGHSVLFTTAEEMMLAHYDMKVHKLPAGKGMAGLLRDFASPSLLILDEMFRQSDTEASDRFLFSVLNARYADCLPTVIISNKDLDEVKALFDPVLVSRLQERGAIYVPFPWEDQRPSVGRGAVETRAENAE
jgi:DNA replication protein DnaC